jgi:hypothetical protein
MGLYDNATLHPPFHVRPQQNAVRQRFSALAARF